MKTPTLNFMDAGGIMAFGGGEAERKRVVLTDPKNELTGQGLTFDGYRLNLFSVEVAEGSNESCYRDAFRGIAQQFVGEDATKKDENLFWRLQSEKLIASVMNNSKQI